ncbi:MAG: hypothetical protein QXD13_01000 [Candidatus Pacearchaeota archaeon]
MKVVVRDTPYEHLAHLLSKKDRKNTYSDEKSAYSSNEILDRSKDPKFLFYEKRSEGDKIRIMKEGGMKGQYLGACLDYVRRGVMNACFWKLEKGGIKGLIEFIQSWMNVNKENLIWSDQPLPDELELPYIHYENCPTDKSHKETIKDCAGRVRCAHVSEKFIKPSFLRCYEFEDNYSLTNKIGFVEIEPMEPDFCDDDYDKNGNLTSNARERLKEYNEEMKKYETEEPIVIKDYCYAIISEPKASVMPLEKILKRLRINDEFKNVYCKDYKCKHSESNGDEKLSRCFGHRKMEKWVGFPFCGWTLAWYVQKWHEQTKSPGESVPLFMKSGERDSYRVLPNFQVISGDE